MYICIYIHMCACMCGVCLVEVGRNRTMIEFRDRKQEEKGYSTRGRKGKEVCSTLQASSPVCFNFFIFFLNLQLEQRAECELPTQNICNSSSFLSFHSHSPSHTHALFHTLPLCSPYVLFYHPSQHIHQNEKSPVVFALNIFAKARSHKSQIPHFVTFGVRNNMSNLHQLNIKIKYT